MRAFGGSGVLEPWHHQVEAARLAASGQHVVLATGTASGKSLGYQLAAGTALAEDPAGTVLYLSPTKALAADQLVAWRALARDGAGWLLPSPYDGDTAPADRTWARDHANVLLTNPDMLHIGILPHHERWGRFFRRLRYVIVDEAHVYRGVFGSHVAVLLRRLARVCAHYGSGPVFIGASATSADPAGSFTRLIGADAVAVTEDASPHGAVTVGFWEPELTDARGENGAPVRRSATAESAGMMADLAVAGTRTIAFIRSRRGAEAMASAAKRELAEVDPSLPPRVAAYRAGYLPEERREVETALRTGRLLGVASTPALELGIDIAGLDAVLVAGWPGTRASFFQQVGRAGRAGQESLAVYVAGDDPLDTFVVHHPEAVFELAVEDSVTDPSNPHILAPHLCAAAAELPLVPDGLAAFGEAGHVRGLVDRLHEARDLHPVQPRPGEPVDQRYLVLGGDDLRLVLEAVARPDLADPDVAREPVAHARWTTRRSWIPTPRVRSPSRTSTSKRHLRSSAISRSLAVTLHFAPSPAPATCLMQTSNPTVAWPSGRCSSASIAAHRSIIPIIPGVERTLTGIVPPTSVRSMPSTVNSSVRSAPSGAIVGRGPYSLARPWQTASRSSAAPARSASASRSA
ncbi:MAG: hypothetical protein MOP51_1931, partial [Citricoccus sp.]|nr:hypothetical protein [Citricoccus sp. WCRC_4]